MHDYYFFPNETTADIEAILDQQPEPDCPPEEFTSKYLAAIFGKHNPDTDTSLGLTIGISRSGEVHKTFEQAPDGAIRKRTGKAFLSVAECQRVYPQTADELAGVLKNATQRQDAVIFSGAIPFDRALAVSSAKIESFDLTRSKGLPIIGMSKADFSGTRWVLLDFDNPPGILEEQKALCIEGRLGLLEKILPGISSVKRVELRSSSSRHVPIGQPGGARSHAWLKIRFGDDETGTPSEKIDRLRNYIVAQGVIRGLAFTQPNISRKTGEVVGYSHRMCLDTATIQTRHLGFVAPPKTAVPGYEIADADVTVVAGTADELDLSGVKLSLTSADREALQRATAGSLEINSAGGLVDYSGLKAETEIELVDGRVVTLAELFEESHGEERIHRCQTPFRESTSTAGKLFIRKDGTASLYDFGTATTHVFDLSNSRVDLAEIDQPSGATKPIGSDAVAETKQPSVASKPLKIVWPQTRSQGKVKVPISTTENLAALLTAFGIVVRFNLMTNRREILIPGSSASRQNAAEVSLAHIDDLCRLHGLYMSSQKLNSSLMRIADQHCCHPAQEWLVSRPWDGLDRLPELYATVKCESPLKELLIRKWMLQAVAAISEPRPWETGGRKAFENVLVFAGPQGCGKTRWFCALLPAEQSDDWSANSFILAPTNKDSVLAANSKWLVELGEIDATFRKADQAALKAFLSCRQEMVRLPYAAEASLLERRTVFFASVNDPEFLQDETGSRRYWVLPVESCQPYAGEHQQLWAQVRELYLEGEDYWLTAEESRQLIGSNAKHQAADPAIEAFETLLAAHREPEGKVFAWSLAELLDVLGLSGSRRGVLNRISAHLDAQQYKRGRVDGARVVYLPVTPASRLDLELGRKRLGLVGQETVGLEFLD